MAALGAPIGHESFGGRREGALDELAFNSPRKYHGAI
jgi:hypothetical protein